MKKIIALILTLVMALSLGACAPAAEESAVSSGESEGGDDIVISVWLNASDDTRLKSFTWAMEEFMKTHDNVTFDVDYLGENSDDYQAKWTAAAQADNFPDIFRTGSGMVAQWAKAGLLADLGAEIYADEEYLSWLQGGSLEFCNAYTPEGTVYCVPDLVETQGWVYNTKLFDQCGLEIPETWEELVHCIEVFNQNGITPVLHGGTDKWAIWGYHSFFTRYGLTYDECVEIAAGEKKFAESEGITKALGRMQELAEMGAYNEDAYTISHTDAWERFKAGQGAMYTVYSNIANGVLEDPEITQEQIDAYAQMEFNFGPEFPDGALERHSGLRYYGWAYAFGKSAAATPEKKALVVEFTKLLSSKEAAQIQADSGSNHATVHEVSYPEKSGIENSFIKSFTQPSDLIPTTDPFVYWFDQAYLDTYYNVVTAVILGQATAEQGVQMLQDLHDSLQ